MRAYRAMRGARIVLGEKFSLLSSSNVKKTKNSSAQNVRLHGRKNKERRKNGRKQSNGKQNSAA